jgi:hypothetical protein
VRLDHAPVSFPRSTAAIGAAADAALERKGRGSQERERQSEQRDHSKSGGEADCQERQYEPGPDVLQQVPAQARQVPFASATLEHDRRPSGRRLWEVIVRTTVGSLGRHAAHPEVNSVLDFTVGLRSPSVAAMRLRLEGRTRQANPARKAKHLEIARERRCEADQMHQTSTTPVSYRRRPLPRRLSPLRRARRVSVIALCMCAVPIVSSYVTTMLGPSNSSFMIRSFEWLRDHGAAGIASGIEGIYYTLNAPATGGPALRTLPLRGSTTVQAVHPPEIAPVVLPPLPGEGVWVPAETWSGTASPVQIAQFRSDRSYPRMVAGVAWIDTRRASIQLYPGRLEPSVTLPRGPMEVPPSMRARLLATFNSGFKLADSGGGFAVGGRTYAALKDGLATLIGYADGRVDIRAWTGGPDVGPGMQYARQDLPLIVAGGRPNPHLSDGPQWGATLGNAIRVWRSGIGIDASGDLVYAAANDQTVRSLAEILIRAGAIRAMQLDINSYWVTFISYAESGAGAPSSLLPGMTRGPYRYLSPDDRDFFAVYLR